MSSSLAQTAASSSAGSEGGEEFFVGRKKEYRDDDGANLQREAEQKGFLALAGLSSASASEIGLHRPLVRRRTHRAHVGRHCCSLYSQVSLFE